MQPWTISVNHEGNPAATGVMQHIHVSIKQIHPVIVESGNPDENTDPPSSGVSCLGSIKVNKIRISMIPWVLSVDLSHSRPLTRNICTQTNTAKDLP